MQQIVVPGRIPHYVFLCMPSMYMCTGCTIVDSKNTLTQHGSRHSSCFTQQLSPSGCFSLHSTFQTLWLPFGGGCNHLRACSPSPWKLRRVGGVGCEEGEWADVSEAAVGYSTLTWVWRQNNGRKRVGCVTGPVCALSAFSWLISLSRSLSISFLISLCLRTLIRVEIKTGWLREFLRQNWSVQRR